MGKKNEIGLGRPVDADQVLNVARSVTESRRYRWEQTGPSSAMAYEGDTEIAGKSSMSLVLGVELRGDRLVLSQESTGGVSAAIGLGPLGSSKVKGEFKDVSRAISDALGKAALTA